MITVLPNGRRKSIFTVDEAVQKTRSMVAALSEDERELLKVFQSENGNNALGLEKEIMSHCYHTIPVTMAQFMDDPYYLGEACSSLYPELRKDLLELFKRPHREVVTTGAIGVGKTHTGSIAICRILYELSCMISPQKVFGMSSASELVIPLISKNLTLSRDVMKTAVDDKIRESPYFMTHFAPKISKEFSLFPHNIRLTIGSYTSERILGTNVFSAFLDECSTKKTLVTIEKHGIVTSETVENLMAMSSLGESDCKIVCLDHDSGTLKSGWWRIKESTIQPIVEIKTDLSAASFSHEHPILVKNGEWMVYKHVKDVVVGDIVAMESRYATKRTKAERGSKTEDFGSCKEKDRGEESFLRKGTFGGNEAEDERSSCKTENCALRGNKAENERIPEGTEVFSRDKEKDERSGEKKMGRSRASCKAVGTFHSGKGRWSRYASSPCSEGGRKSVLREEALKEDKETYQRGTEGYWGIRSYGRIKAKDFRGECAGDKRQSTQVSVPGEVSMRGNGSMPDCSGRKTSERDLFSAGGRERNGRGQKRLGKLRDRRATTTNGCRLHGNSFRWTGYCSRGESAIFSVCGKGEEKVLCNVELLQEKRIHDDSGYQWEANAGYVQGAIRNTGVCRSGNERTDSCSKNGDELKFAGVREERIRVSDLPSSLFLSEITSVSSLPADRTYSICTEFNTFIADGIVVHNTNFPPKRNVQQISTGFGVKRDIAHFDIVEKMYRTMLRRIKSRFQKAGGSFPGMIILASSAATVDSFVERKLRASINNPEVFVRDHTQWTAKPHEDNFCGEMFYILCSKSSMIARILKKDEYEMISEAYLDANDAWIMDVPIEFLEDFESDMEEALRDIGGISTQAMSIYIQRPNKVLEAIDKNRVHPFTKEEWIAGTPGGFKWDMMVREFERRLPGGFMENSYAPIRNPEAMRWCHIDVSISGDCTGFCVGHIERWVEVVRKGANGERFTDIAPYYVIDVMLRIVPPPSEQIYMPDLRQLIYLMMDRGYKFVGFSSDTYMYVEMHQQLRRKGITPHLLSMDRTTVPYDELKSAFYENRIEIYDYAPFIDEFKKLEYDRVVGKIDHVQGESKDISDAVGGCVFSLKESAARMPLYADVSKKREANNEYSWVSPLLVNTEENRELVKQIPDGDALEVMPILFGDDF